jgi:hypothetical protein
VTPAASFSRKIRYKSSIFRAPYVADRQEMSAAAWQQKLCDLARLGFEDSNGGRESTTIFKTGTFNRHAAPVDDRGNPV